MILVVYWFGRFLMDFGVVDEKSVVEKLLFLLLIINTAIDKAD